jgi:hypothetical protein
VEPAGGASAAEGREHRGLERARTAVVRPRGVTARAAIIGLALTPLNVLFLVKGIWMWAGAIGGQSIFPQVVAALFALVLANLWLKRRRPAWALSAGEMLTVYVVLSVGTGLTCSVWSVGGSTMIYATHAFWFATDQNHWQQVVWPNLPTWLTVRDRSVLTGFYQGGVSPYTRQILGAWAAPALWWTLLFATLMWVALCLNSIVRRRWADEEKLSFPLTVLPVQLCEEGFGLLRSRLFWLGVAVAGGLAAWNIAAGFVPALPAVPTHANYATYVENNRPWNFLRFYDVYWGPWQLGLAYLIPLDLSFSLFVFAWVWAAEYVISGQLGWCVNKWSGFPYGEQQTAGGFIAVALVVLWLDRRFLGQVVKRAVGLRKPFPDEESEGLGYRTAFFGLVAGLGVLCWLLLRARVTGWVVPVVWVQYFLMILVISRLRAQLGPPSHQLYGAMPSWVLTTAAGSRVLGPRTMGMFYLLRPLMQEQQSHAAPFQLEGLKMAEGGRMERRRLAILMAVVPVVALLSYFWATLHVGYQLGMGTGRTHVFNQLIGTWGTQEMVSNIENPSAPSVSGLLAMGTSAAITSILYYLKLRFVWWPLHPLAYPIAMSNTIASITPALLLTWAVKSLLLKYGGLRAHRTALPLFLGFLVGEATVSAAQLVVFEAFNLRL